ncbi:MAG TPA: cytochrome c3 family protein [Anaerolineales bacterium]|nr:cytochrome c3 family protein [Anaerolineales bacterium]
MSRRLPFWLPLLLALVAFPFLAAPGPFTPPPQDIDNDTCLACHGQPGQTRTLPSGEVLSLYVSPLVFDRSVHGQQNLNCVDCHTNITGFPHPPFEPASRREFVLQMYTACQACHAGEYALTQDSVHERARAAGQPAAAVCTDCHGSHDIQRMTDDDAGEILPEARTRIPQTCARCHSTIYDKYLTSVHGSALLGEGNPDVPTCIDCHGVHNIEDPTTTEFRLRSPSMCARCHTDAGIMDKYGLSTRVLQTYVADFHGTTVTLFEKITPDAETNKPVCYDCHGIHDIRRTDDPRKGLQVRENLLARCQRCHPTATANFPDAWLSHYIPSPDKTPLVYAVDLFYKLFIPATLGGMAALVALDAMWQLRRRLPKRPPALPPADVPPAAPVVEPPPAEPAPPAAEESAPVESPEPTQATTAEEPAPPDTQEIAPPPPDDQSAPRAEESPSPDPDHE